MAKKKVTNQRVKGWAAVIHAKLDKTIDPPEVILQREGNYTNPQEALDMACRKCQEIHGIGYSIEPIYSTTASSIEQGA